MIEAMKAWSESLPDYGYYMLMAYMMIGLMVAAIGVSVAFALWMHSLSKDQ